MPVDFLTEEQKAGSGQFSGEPNEAQLSRYFLLDKTDLDFISDRRGEQNRLGFALLITLALWSRQYVGALLIHIGGYRHEGKT